MWKKSFFQLFSGNAFGELITRKLWDLDYWNFYYILGNTHHLMYQNGRSMSYKVLELRAFLWKKSVFKLIYFNAPVTLLESLLHKKYKTYSLEIYDTYRETLTIECIKISKWCLLWFLSYWRLCEKTRFSWFSEVFSGNAPVTLLGTLLLSSYDT